MPTTNLDTANLAASHADALLRIANRIRQTAAERRSGVQAAYEGHIAGTRDAADLLTGRLSDAEFREMHATAFIARSSDLATTRAYGRAYLAALTNVMAPATL